MSDGQRLAIFERFLDDLELYFDLKRDLNKKIKRHHEEGDYETDVYYWQEYETLENLRERARRTLDEYVASRPDHHQHEPSPEQVPEVGGG